MRARWRWHCIDSAGWLPELLLFWRAHSSRYYRRILPRERAHSGVCFSSLKWPGTDDDAGDDDGDGVVAQISAHKLADKQDHAVYAPVLIV